MNIQQIVSDTNYPVRTQISLSSSLYRAIREEAKRKETSLADIIRKHVIEGLQREEEGKRNNQELLRKLANAPWDELTGEAGGWRKVKNPHKLIRKWRQDDDKKREEMMAKTS